MMQDSKSGRGKKTHISKRAKAATNENSDFKREKKQERMKSTAATATAKRKEQDYRHSDLRGRRSSVLPDVDLGKIADSAGISVGYLSKLIRGIGNPSIPTARRIADAMGMELVTFLATIEREQKQRAGKKK